ncbi:MAG: DNA polymerase III subunit epsilon [Gammaproteobacteria bacterium]|nr:MAG: DNA polymerase III subunit epsilon [Gammaproteobacteria bacterium]
MNKTTPRQVVLDTETTGLEISDGHRIIEIGCIEISSRRPTGRRFQHYVRPDRHIDPGALEIHGITIEQLADKPPFADIVDELMEFIGGAELIIHNAPFDMEFLNHELGLFENRWSCIDDHVAGVLDTLVLARRLHPGMKNSLDALCKRYDVDNSNRTLHGALLDAELLAEVYLAMTGGQSSMTLPIKSLESAGRGGGNSQTNRERAPLRVIRASDAERKAHAERLRRIDENSGGQCVWLRGEDEPLPTQN